MLPPRREPILTVKSAIMNGGHFTVLGLTAALTDRLLDRTSPIPRLRVSMLSNTNPLVRTHARNGTLRG